MCQQATLWITLFLRVPVPYFGLHSPSLYADRHTQRFYTNVVLGPPFTGNSPQFAPTLHRLSFVSSIEIAWRPQNSVSLAAYCLQCPWRSRLCGFPNFKSRDNPNTKQRSKSSNLSGWDCQHMGDAKEKDVEGTMLWQCHAPVGMPFVIAVSLELWALWVFQP